MFNFKFVLIVLLLILILLIVNIILFSNCIKNKNCKVSKNKKVRFDLNNKYYDLEKMSEYFGGGNGCMSFNSNNIPYLQKSMESIGWAANSTSSDNTHFSFDNNTITQLCGQMPQLGLEFSDKIKLAKHFKDKSFFPKWISGVAIKKSENSELSILDAQSILDNSQSILEKYIQNPLLYKGKKFNLQVYLAIYVRPKNKMIQALLNTDYNMQVASEKYSNSNYNNKNIHISNITTNIDDNELKERTAFINHLLTNHHSINEQIYEIVHSCEVVSKQFHTSTLAAFELLTLDVLIDENYKVWLMDMHSSLGSNELGTIPKLPNNASSINRYWNWVLYNVIMANFGLHTSIWGLQDSNNVKSVQKVQPLKFPAQPQITLPPNIQLQKEIKPPRVICTNQLTIQPLYLATENDLKELSTIGSIPEVYKYISYGKKWDYGHVRKLYKDSIVDSTILCRDYYHWVLIYEHHCIGYIGIRPYEDSNVLPACAIKTYLKPPSNIDYMQRPEIVKGEINCYQMRYFISPDYRGKKLAAIAGMHIAHFFKSIYPKKTLLANVLTENIASIKTAINIGMHKAGTHNEYTIMEYK
jgi:RimJ/RimL family protein N-acetyltransferase